MALLDHLGVSVIDIEQGRRQFHPVLTALGYTPAASYADSIRPYVAWLRRHADDWQTAFPVFKSYPSDPFDYAAENAAA